VCDEGGCLSRIALGTVQFGMDYGINNTKGKVPAQEAHRILKYALENNVDTLDTAGVYGDSEKVIGEFTGQGERPFKIVSKLTLKEDATVEGAVHDSLEKLRVKSLYGYLIHDFKAFVQSPAIWQSLEALKKQGKVQKIGFSLYFPQDLQFLWEHNIAVDIVQVPFSVLDQRFAPWFKKLKEKQTKIHVRSVFLQGLMFKNTNALTGRFLKIKGKLETLNALSLRINVPIAGLCINFAALNPGIEQIVLGVDSLDDFKQNVQMLQYKDKVKTIYADLLALAEEDENIILPFNWETGWGKKGPNA
jgi:aryl-alcohol dehydrogenase-like predicted oxidoreductase